MTFCLPFILLMNKSEIRCPAILFNSFQIFLSIFVPKQLPVDSIMDITNPADTIRCWVDLYSETLLSWAYHKTQNQQTAEDLVQDTFLSAVQAFHNFKGNSEPKTWLFSILNNKITDHYRKELKKPIVNDDRFLANFFDENGHWRNDAMPTEWNVDEELLDNSEFQHVLKWCMQKLPSVWLLVIRLKYFENKGGSEICKELEISSSNFWQLIHRSKLQLRKCLDKNWFNK